MLVKSNAQVPMNFDAQIAIIVDTVAGHPNTGFVNSIGTNARFGLPTGAVIDASGDVIVVDQFNNCIRKVTPGGAVTTLAGSITGFADGTGPVARFSSPHSVAVDYSTRNFFVTDTVNHRIRKVTPNGVVNTLAGSGTSAFANGAGTGASFSHPRGIAVDSSTGDVIVADTHNYRIRKVTPGGVVTTLAGSGWASLVDGTGTDARFALPFGLAVGSTGNVIVADTYNNCIRKVTPGGVVTTLAGSGAIGFVDGEGTAALFGHPYSVAEDSSNTIYITDTGNHLIRKLTPDGVVKYFCRNRSELDN